MSPEVFGPTSNYVMDIVYRMPSRFVPRPFCIIRCPRCGLYVSGTTKAEAIRRWDSMSDGCDGDGTVGRVGSIR